MSIAGALLRRGGEGHAQPSGGPSARPRGCEGALAALHEMATRLHTLPARTLETFASDQSGRYNHCLGRFEGQYEWDPVKAEANLCKHKISFETATKVFDDPNFLLKRGLDR
jgi:Ribonuclease toxin, BrnT, of type II toxin-antitoxin system